MQYEKGEGLGGQRTCFFGGGIFLGWSAGPRSPEKGLVFSLIFPTLSEEITLIAGPGEVGPSETSYF